MAGETPAGAQGGSGGCATRARDYASPAVPLTPMLSMPAILTKAPLHYGVLNHDVMSMAAQVRVPEMASMPGMTGRRTAKLEGS